MRKKRALPRLAISTKVLVDMSDRTTKNQSPLHRRLWLWFAAGFGIVFLMIALIWPMNFYNGLYLRPTMLWQYYFLEIHVAWNSSGYLGPTSDNASAALGVAATHILISTVCGAISAVIGWATRNKSLYT